MSDLQTLALESMRVRITGVLPSQIRSCLDALTDEQIWWRPNEGANSVGNLVLHLTGSLNHYLNRALGGFSYERDRAAEFSERRMIPKAELRAKFDDMVKKADQTLSRIAPRLLDPSPEPLHVTIFEDIVGILTHISTHTGQIVWITKMLHEEGVTKDLWMKTHRDGGAWKPARA